ncbi:MAG: zinc ABC transporter substrate-binding protein [Acidimicrobiia bacterium]|nr:zinc ABC transporter substrate-binding protein [Acidimicrobiia bacterium]
MATTAIVGDVVANVVGDHATVEVVIPLGADPHDFRPSARQLTAIAGADLVVAIGLGMEETMGDVLAAAATEGTTILELGPQLDPIPGDDGGVDPHVWLDPERMAVATRLIAGALTDLDSTVDWGAAADTYAAQLAALDDEIATILDAVPADRRKLVTNHESLGYFADRYGFDVVGVIVPGGSTLAEPSSADIAALAEVIANEEVLAIFAETTEPATLAEAVAAEADTEVAVVELFTESMGEPGSAAGTLIGMLRIDAERIAEALS